MCPTEALCVYPWARVVLGAGDTGEKQTPPPPAVMSQYHTSEHKSDFGLKPGPHIWASRKSILFAIPTSIYFLIPTHHFTGGEGVL